MFTSLRRLLSPRLAPQAADIPTDLWEAQLPRFAPLRTLAPAEQQDLRRLCAEFLAAKSLTGAAGLVLTPGMQLHIAVQACLPIRKLGLSWYRDWHGVVVYPAQFRVHRRVKDEIGVEHDYDETLAGEAWDGGPVVLSWEDSAPPSAHDAPAGDHPGNVVIHEFAHTLDLLDGVADGVPPLDPRLHPGLDTRHWAAVLDDAYERHCAELDLIESEIPRDVDPDSPQAERYYARLPLDPYAATDPAEFFAVSSEALFMAPEPLAAAFPSWHALLRQFYRLDAPGGGYRR